MSNISTIIISKIRSIIKGATKPKVPGPKTPPMGISEKAAKLWPKFWKKYGKIVRQYKNDYPRNWAVAVAIFKNYCTKRNVAPFSADSSYLNQSEASYMKRRFKTNREKLSNKIVTTLKIMKKKDLANKSLKERFEKIIYNNRLGAYDIYTKIIIVLPKELKFNSPEIITFFKNRGFDKKRGKLVFTSGTHKLVVIPSESENRLLLNSILSFKPQHVKFILGIHDKDLKNKKKVITALTKEVKKLIKKNIVTNKITGKCKIVSFIDKRNRKNIIYFDEPLTEDQETLLSNTMQKIKMLNPNDIKIKFSIDYIRSLNTPIYQYNLIKKLIKKFEESKIEVPDILIAARDNPNDYLNPKILQLIDKKDIESPESAI